MYKLISLEAENYPFYQINVKQTGAYIICVLPENIFVVTLWNSNRVVMMGVGGGGWCQKPFFLV